MGAHYAFAALRRDASQVSVWGHDLDNPSALSRQVGCAESLTFESMEWVGIALDSM
ncbi:MAG: hypothetical protein GAK28_02918 [Luteibacter sp.]|nr:MAG: hypothetical protein GAK28_02918 [Luteibacter sp.]